MCNVQSSPHVLPSSVKAAHTAGFKAPVKTVSFCPFFKVKAKGIGFFLRGLCVVWCLEKKRKERVKRVVCVFLF